MSKRSHNGKKIEEYAELHPNLSCWEIAKELGVSHQTVYNHIGARGNLAKENRKQKILNTFREHPELSDSQIAEMLGFTYPTIHRYRKMIEGENQ